MKKYYLLLIAFNFCLFSSCQDDHDSASSPIINACGVKDPAQNIPWLQDLISKAEEDRMNKTYNGAYTGTIQLDHYQETDVFIIRMIFIGGLYALIYNCDGTAIDFGNDTQAAYMFLTSDSNLQKAPVIYSTMR